MTTPPPRSPAEYWPLDPAVTYLNHGSFGACPQPVLDAQAELRAQMEREPVRFLDVQLEARLDEARQALANFVDGQPADIAFVTNATTGVSTVLRALAFAPGDELLTTDHEYNAVRNALDTVARASGARVVTARVPFPLSSPDEAVEAVTSAATARTRLAVISHVTSPTALVLPIERIVGQLAERGIDTLVDGAHAPGMVPLALDRLAAAYYAGNCHKWLCAPKGSGFLWVRRDRPAGICPLVVSHGANSPRTERSRFLLEFDWTGTADPTAWLAIPAAIDFIGRLDPDGWAGLMAHNHRLVVTARELLGRRLDITAPAPAEMIGAMAALDLPADVVPPAAPRPPDAPPGATYPPDALREVLFERFAIEVPVFAWPGVPDPARPRRRLVRISAQAYNSLPDYERLADALTKLRN